MQDEMEKIVPNETWFRENQERLHGLGINVSVEPEQPVYVESDDHHFLEEISQELPPIVFDLNSLLKRKFPPISWRVNQLVPNCGLVALSGLPGSGKSWITEHLALCAAQGKPLFGNFDVHQGNVLIIDKENQLSLVQKRFRLLGGSENSGIYFLAKDFLIEDEQVVTEVVDLIRTYNIKLVIIDSLIRIYRKKDENSSNDMAEVFRQIKKFQDVGSAVVFTHHHRKQSIMNKNIASESMRGSSDILAAVDCHLAIDKTEDGIRITQTKLRQEIAVPPFKIKLEGDEEHVELNFIGEVQEDKEKVEEAKMDIYEVLEEGEVTRTELIERFKGRYGSKSIDAALKSFTATEVIVRIGDRGKRYYKRADSKIDNGLFEPVLQNSNV